AEWQRFFVSDEEAVRRCLTFGERAARRDDCADRRNACNRRAQRVARRAETEHKIKAPQHRSHRLAEIVTNASERKRPPSRRRGAAAARAQKLAIEDQRALCRLGHGRLSHVLSAVSRAQRGTHVVRCRTGPCWAPSSS